VTGWTRHKRDGFAGARDGAALVTAILVLLLLFTLVITATILSRQEVRIAANVADTVRAKFVAEAGINIGIAALNADLSTSRAITSIARIMQTYYGERWWIVQGSVLAGREEDIPADLWLPVFSEYDDTDGDGIIYGPEMQNIVGRYVFAIVDEASKININVAGNPGVGFGGEYHRSNEGVSPAEIDMGVLPGIDSGDAGLAHRFPYFRFGAPGGEPLSGRPPSAFEDTAHPGLANTDDNVNNLFLSMDGVDNDGDGLVDEAIFLGTNRLVEHYRFRTTIAALAAAARAYWVYQPVEGIDEPDEFRPFRPVGGDRAVKTIEQAILIDGIAEKRFNDIRDSITVNSFDRAVIFSSQIGDSRKEDLKLNLNLDNAYTIANTLVERRGEYFGGDRGKAFQIAANIADFRDADFARTEVIDSQTGSVYAGTEPIRINEMMVRPVWRIEAEWGWPYNSTSDTLGYTWEYSRGIEPNGIGTTSYLYDPHLVDYDPKPGIQRDERRILTIYITPPGPCYLILDLTDGQGGYSGDVEYFIEPYYGLGWQRTDVNNSPKQGFVVIDINPSTDGVEPLREPVILRLRKLPDGAPDVPYVNGVILSQEPDMEWVELVNVGTKPVTLDNWELEITGSGIGTIPPNTVIQPGGFLLLTVDKQDAIPPGASERSIFGNGMNLAYAAPFALDPARVVQLVFRNNVVEATKEMILGGGMFPNDPREDGLDNDGDGDPPVDENADMPYLHDVVPVIGEMQVVTLYEGPAQWGRVVDRVTYSSADVANADRPTFHDMRNNWLLDFYRSLERTNPYYPGDRLRDPVTNELHNVYSGEPLYRDGNYDDWAPVTDWSRLGTPLGHNVTVLDQSASRGDFELTYPRVKNANFSTVGELVDVPFWNPADDLRPTTMSIPDVARVLELVTTSRQDLTWGQADLLEGSWDREWIPEDRWGNLWLGVRTNTNGESATWLWNASDGLEDGVYNLYVFVGELQPGHPDTRPVTIEVFTDRDRNGDLYIPGTIGVESPDKLGVAGPLVARPDGVISYGTVEVHGNMLAVRLRNEADDGVPNTFTRIALAPRRRDYGKLNVNTVQNADVLCALPGLLQQWRPDDYRLEPSPDSREGEGAVDLARLRARALVGLRDGDPELSYFREPGPYRSLGDVLETMYEVARFRPDLFELSGTFDDPSRFKEILERFKRISNLITVRSDVFEIICVGQAGRVIGDEFVPAAEKKIRVVYER